MKEGKIMSAKILQFTPRPDNRIYFPKDKTSTYTPQKIAEPIAPKIPYLESLKIPKTKFTKRETAQLNEVGFFWDKKYQAFYPSEEAFDHELVEKRGRNFFYLEVMPFNMYPSSYKHFTSIKQLVIYLKSIQTNSGGFAG